MKAALRNAIVASALLWLTIGTTTAHANLITLSFASQGSTGTYGVFVFDTTALAGGPRPGGTVAAEYFGALKSAIIGSSSDTYFAVAPHEVSFRNKITIHDDIVQIDPSVPQYAQGDGVELNVVSGDLSLYARLLFPDLATIDSLSLGDLDLNASVASAIPSLPLAGGGSYFSFVSVTRAGTTLFVDGYASGTRFSVSNVAEPGTAMLILGALGLLAALRPRATARAAAGA